MNANDLSCPESLLGRLACGQHTTGFGETATEWAASHGWTIMTILAGLTTLHCGWRLVTYGKWRSAARSACWLDITPAANTSLGSTIELWRLLAALLPAEGLFTLRPYRLVWEVHTTADTTRVGLWIPAWMNPSTVASVVQRAWPGARTESISQPQLTGIRAIRTLRPRDPEWLPIVEVTWQGRRADHDERDRPRAVFDALALAGRSGRGVLQVIVARAPRRRSAAMCRAALNPASAHRRNGLAAADLLIRLLRGSILAVLDLFARSTTTPRTSDLALVDRQRRIRLKVADPPHFLISIRIAAGAVNRKAARGSADDIVGGFTLISPHLIPGNLAFGIDRCRFRWSPVHRMFLASVSEVAAVAGLPIDPAVHGLRAAAARRRAANTDTWSPGEGQ